MISLNSPITITPDPVNGKPIRPTTLTSIDYSVTYDNSQQQAIARIKGVNLNLILWSQHTTPPYSSIGQFTDTDTDNRISNLLNVAGGDSAIKEAIESLYVQAPYVKPAP